MAALLLVSGTALPANADEEPPVAKWNGSSIMYDGHQYFGMNPAKAGESHGLPVGTNYYTHVETISERPMVQKAHVIYFPTGTDPPTATSANYVVYDYLSGRVFANPGTVQTITAEPSGTSESFETSCAIEGVGWIVCGASYWLAEGMDWLFGVLSSMMATQPLVTGDSNNDLYVAWNVMRSIANVAFIIAFIIIIYSQLTNFGIDNYGLKKLIPRLIIAALLVNLSYYICAVALDLSNIAGYSLQDIFIQIRENTFNVDEDTWSADVLDWRAVTAFVLSGGTVGFLGISAATAGSVTSAAFLIVPILLALLLTALFVLVVLAARQAIIIILIVIAPLAFVAYLLPNTEKWFERWRELFMTMLIFFPAFSLVFGGSQLAGGIILQNATTLIMLVFGLAVQIAPLAITPLLLKLSGGLLGRIAGMVNDPRKGLMDRTRNWAKDRGEMHRQKSLANKSGIPGLRRVNPFRIAAQNMDNGNQRVKEATEKYALLNQNRYGRTRGHRRLYGIGHSGETQKQIIEKQLETAHNNKIQGSRRLFNEQLELSTVTDRNEASKTSLERGLKEAKLGTRLPNGIRANGTTRFLMREGREGLKHLAAQKAGMQAADLMIQKMIAESFNVRLKADHSNLREYRASQELLKIAGGIDPTGMARAQAAATAAIEKLEKEAHENLISNFNSTAVASGKVPKKVATEIIERRLAGDLSDSKDMVSAAMDIVFEDGQTTLAREVRMSGYFDQDEVWGMLTRKAGVMKEKGGFDLQADPTLANAPQFRMDSSLAASLGGTPPDGFSKLKNGVFTKDAANMARIIANTAVEPDARRKQDAEDGLRKTYFNLTRALNDSDIVNQMGDNLVPAIDMHKKLHAHFGDPAKTIIGGYDAIDPRI